MAKKKSGASSSTSSGNGGLQRGAKSAAIRSYFEAHKDAKPKEVIAALKADGIEVSANMVSVIKAKLGSQKARRGRRSGNQEAGAAGDNSRGLEAALTLYKAARGQRIGPQQVTNAFLALVEVLS